MIHFHKYISSMTGQVLLQKFISEIAGKPVFQRGHFLAAAEQALLFFLLLVDELGDVDEAAVCSKRDTCHFLRLELFQH